MNIGYFFNTKNQQTFMWKQIIFFISSFLLLFFTVGCNDKSHITLQGYIDGKYTYLASAVGGKLIKLPIGRGDQAKVGQLMFELDPEPEVSLLLKAKNQLTHDQQISEDLQKGQRETIIKAIEAQRAQASANLDFATVTLVRYQKLYKTGTIDKGTLDQATTTYQTSRDRLHEIEANLSEAKLGSRENLIAAQKFLVEADKNTVNQAQWAFEQKTIKAPINAVVFDTLHQTGEYISPGQAVVVLLPKETLKVIFFVPEKYLSLLKRGENIEFSCDGCPQNYKATINFISPNTEYTPPVIFSKDSRDKLVYRIEAPIEAQAADKFSTGQPVDVFIKF